MTTDRFTFSELIQACKNIGYDLTCGACAELFFTGVRLHRHDEKCETVKNEAPGTITETTVHISGDPEGFPSLYDRTPEGYVNNCALANGAEQKDCQVCIQCPDRERFKAAPSLLNILGNGSGPGLTESLFPPELFDDPKNKLQCSVCGAKSTPLDGCRGTGGPCVIRRPKP